MEPGRCIARIIHSLWPNVAYFLLGLAPRWRGMQDDNLRPGVVRQRLARKRRRIEREEATTELRGTAASEDQDGRRGGGGACPQAPPPPPITRNAYESLEPEMSRDEIREQLNQLEYLSKRLSALQSRDKATRKDQGEHQPLILLSKEKLLSRKPTT